MSPPACKGMRKGRAATIARGSRIGQRRKASARAAEIARASSAEGEEAAGVLAEVGDLRRVPLVAEDQGGEEDQGDGHRRRTAPARRAGGSPRPPRRRRSALRRRRGSRSTPPSRPRLATGKGPAGDSVQADGAGRDQDPVLAEEFDPQLVAARRGGSAVAAAAVPVEGEEVVALEEAVAGEGDDQLPARLHHLDHRVVGLGDPEADPLAVEAAVPVRGEARGSWRSRR